MCVKKTQIKHQATRIQECDQVDSLPEILCLVQNLRVSTTCNSGQVGMTRQVCINTFNSDVLKIGNMA